MRKERGTEQGGATPHTSRLEGVSPPATSVSVEVECASAKTMGRPTAELGEYFGKILGVHPTASSSIFRIVLTQVVPLSSLRVRKNRESLVSQFKLFFISSLVRVMDQALLTVCFLDLPLCTVPRHAQNLVIILGLTPLESCLGFLELRLKRS